MSGFEKSGVQKGPRRVFRLKYLVAAVVLVAVILVGVSTVETVAPLSVVSESVTNQGPQVAYATFHDIGNYYVHAQCTNVNATRMCPVLVSMSLTADGMLHDSLYTRSLTFKVNVPGTTLAVEVDTYSSPATSYPVAYGVDQPLSPYVTITTPSNAPSVTWTFMIIVRNTPVIDGKMDLQIIGQAQVVDSHFLGRTYDLTSGVMQLTDY